MENFPSKDWTYNIIGAAMEVHSVLGPGFLEEIYQRAFERELTIRKILLVAQQHIKVEYKDLPIADYYLDLIVENKVVVELKAVSQRMSVHEPQLISYLKAGKYKIGLLFNFGERSLKHKRLAL